MTDAAATWRLLVVSSDDVLRSRIEEALASAGLVAVLDDEADPARAIERALTGEHDTIVIGGGGAALVERLGAAGVTTPALVAVPAHDPEQGRAATAAGALDVVVVDGRGPEELGRRLVTALRTGRAEREVSRLMDEARQARSSRDDLLSMVSHDLRSPLNAIGLACEALDSELPAEERRRYVAAIRRASQRAERLLRDLIDASRIESGSLRLERWTVTARALLEATRNEHAAAASAAGAELELDIVGDPGGWTADAARLQQALGYLIGNAIKFAKGSRITIEARGDDDAIELAVVDRGPGIEVERLATLFGRVQLGRNPRRGGAGLGLAIARGIAEAHGGTLTATSELGQGSRFVMRIPRR